jgi:hypothetical protein
MFDTAARLTSRKSKVEPAGALAGGVMSVHLKLLAQDDSLGPAAVLRCDHCRGELGLDVDRYRKMQFCSSACMTAYQRRLAPETIIKICRLDVLPSDDQTGGSNFPLPLVSWLALWGF